MEIAELMKKDGQMYDWASKIEYKRELNSEEKEISEVMNSLIKTFEKEFSAELRG